MPNILIDGMCRFRLYGLFRLLVFSHFHTLMLLFDSLHQASTAMSASQLGLQVTGQNLTNAQTPGYVRESLLLETGTSRKLGNGTVIGTGVQVSGVIQVIDKFLEERLRSSNSDMLSSSTQEKFYTELEALLNETTESDLSSSLGEFFNSIDNILSHPENVSFRQMTVEQGVKLTNDIKRIADSVVSIQRGINTSINDSANEINRLVKKIDELNRNISLLETKEGHEAMGLRDERLNALSDLSKLINIKTTENTQTGSVSIYCGSDILLMDGVRNEIFVGGRKAESDDVVMAELCIRDTMTPLDVRSGSVYGLYQAHSQILGGYAEKLNHFAENLIQEFNTIYSSGQGLTGYNSVTSLAMIDQPELPISLSDLDFPVENGVFTIMVNNKPYEIRIEVNESPTIDPFSLKPIPTVRGTSLNDIASAIDSIDNISATVNWHGQLEIIADDSSTEFSFSNDTSGIFAALGINTFFTGTNAATIGINPTVLSDPSKFAASDGGVGQNTGNGVQLAAMAVASNLALGGVSIIEYYDGIVSETMLAGGIMKSVASSNSLYQQSLQTQRDSISGVNIDEETILMMTYQRMFQANSRLVTVIDEMLETLINL
ncbi:MAG: flagellar hook-associated protein FlgK [Planctomycetaceae bacterium]|nr:flagellar hook-associated protein FlgK [Planctomycetaceae bacterium]